MAVKQGSFSDLDIALDHIAVLITFWLNVHSSCTVQFVLLYTDRVGCKASPDPLHGNVGMSAL